MDFFGYDTCDKLIWTSGEGFKITDKISNKELLKHILIRYLLHQHSVLDVPPMRTLVIYCQNIWFRQYFKHILQISWGNIELYKEG